MSNDLSITFKIHKKIDEIPLKELLERLSVNGWKLQSNNLMCYGLYLTEDEDWDYHNINNMTIEEYINILSTEIRTTSILAVSIWHNQDDSYVDLYFDKTDNSISFLINRKHHLEIQGKLSVYNDVSYHLRQILPWFADSGLAIAILEYYEVV